MSPELIIALKAAVLGVVEGLTEFLPVSSTGHLIVASHLLDYGSPEFDVAIQLGAMLALTWAYRERLLQLLHSLLLVSYAVEVWKQPEVIHAGSARIDRIREPRP